MKIALWIGLCGLCLTAGHVILGGLGILLLLGSIPIRRTGERGAGERELVLHR
ncbi:hypothetical protein [Amycolatopsis sp. NPDC059021]|uniref:hypothetical protein n=1 Tax=Amycolatopsis sp. NPDC059021 TaxID=3346704 RepID=UPI00366C1088